MPDLDILDQLVHDVGADTALKLLEIFKNDADARIAKIDDYLQNGGDIAELRIQAHSLKGLCLTYGAVEGGEAARALQDACDGANETEVRAQAQAARDILKQDIAATLTAAQTRNA